MAALFQTFDPTEVEARGDFEILPTGDYVMQIIDSAMKPNKAGTGHYAELTFSIMDGALEGRKYWERLNLDHPNDVAVKIARQALKEICDAIGLAVCTDTEQLHFKAMTVKITAKARKNEPGMMENTARFAPLTGAAPLVSSAAKMTPAAASAVAQGAPAGAAKAKPWEKKK